MTFIKSCSIDSRNEQSPTCGVVHGTWNKAHFINLLANTYQASTVSRALEWWSWQNLTEPRIMKNPYVHSPLPRICRKTLPTSRHKPFSYHPPPPSTAGRGIRMGIGVGWYVSSRIILFRCDKTGSGHHEKDRETLVGSFYACSDLRQLTALEVNMFDLLGMKNLSKYICSHKVGCLIFRKTCTIQSAITIKNNCTLVTLSSLSKFYKVIFVYPSFSRKHKHWNLHSAVIPSRHDLSLGLFLRFPQQFYVSAMTLETKSKDDE